jgi:hypothetical protein
MIRMGGQSLRRPFAVPHLYDDPLRLNKQNQVQRAPQWKGQADCDKCDGNSREEFRQFTPCDARVVGTTSRSKKTLQPRIASTPTVGVPPLNPKY